MAPRTFLKPRKLVQFIVYSVHTIKLQDCHFSLLNQVIEIILLHIGNCVTKISHSK